MWAGVEVDALLKKEGMAGRKRCRKLGARRLVLRSAISWVAAAAAAAEGCAASRSSVATAAAGVRWMEGGGEGWVLLCGERGARSE
jgi:hypothetical protein